MADDLIRQLHDDRFCGIIYTKDPIFVPLIGGNIVKHAMEKIHKYFPKEAAMSSLTKHKNNSPNDMSIKSDFLNLYSRYLNPKNPMDDSILQSLAINTIAWTDDLLKPVCENFEKQAWRIMQRSIESDDEEGELEWDYDDLKKSLAEEYIRDENGMHKYEDEIDDIVRLALELYRDSAVKAMGLAFKLQQPSASQQRSAPQQRSTSQQRSDSVDRRTLIELKRDGVTDPRRLTLGAWRQLICEMGFRVKPTENQKKILKKLQSSAGTNAGTSNSQAALRPESRGHTLNLVPSSGPPSRTGSPSTRQPGASGRRTSATPPLERGRKSSR